MFNSGYAYVIPRLAQGSDPPLGVPGPFDYVVLCAKEHQEPRLIRTIYAPLDDGPPPTKEEVLTAFVAADEATRHWKRGKHVLIVCHQGRNRSGLVMGLVLLNLGDNAENAIARVRSARGPNALSNRYFRTVLRVRAKQLRRESHVSQ